MPSLNDIYWMAGLIEGEGCFTFAINGAPYKGKKYMTSQITIKMTDKDIVERAAKLLGVTCVKIGKMEYSYYKQAYKCRAVGPRARGWMMTIYPLMSRRRKDKIREILNKEIEYALT